MENEIRSVRTAELSPINLEVTAVVATVRTALPQILHYREQVARVGKVHLDSLDKLSSYADSLGAIQDAYRAATVLTGSVTQLAAEVTKIRSQLHMDAVVLARRGLMDFSRVTSTRARSGYHGIAMDVIALVALFREHSHALQNRTAVTEDELERGAKVAGGLVEALAERDQSLDIINAASLLRQQAYTLLVKAYDEVRRAIIYLRWHHGDADVIAPSLWAGRGRKRSDQARVQS